MFNYTYYNSFVGSKDNGVNGTTRRKEKFHRTMEKIQIIGQRKARTSDEWNGR